MYLTVGRPIGRKRGANEPICPIIKGLSGTRGRHSGTKKKLFVRLVPHTFTFTVIISNLSKAHHTVISKCLSKEAGFCLW